MRKYDIECIRMIKKISIGDENDCPYGLQFLKLNPILIESKEVKEYSYFGYAYIAVKREYHYRGLVTNEIPVKRCLKSDEINREKKFDKMIADRVLKFYHIGMN